MNAIDQRFDQPSFDTYTKMESLLIKTLNSQDKAEELKFMEKLYNDDVDREVKLDVYGKRQTAKIKLLPSVFSSLYSTRIEIFVFAVNSKRHLSIFV